MNSILKTKSKALDRVTKHSISKKNYKKIT